MIPRLGREAERYGPLGRDREGSSLICAANVLCIGSCAQELDKRSKQRNECALVPSIVEVSFCVAGGDVNLDHPFIPLLGRLLIVYIFLTSGIAKVFSWSDNIAYMSTRHLPMIPVLLGIATIIELGGSLCLITGYQARLAAVIMFVYMIAVTVLFHNYWAASGHMAGMQETQFRKNLAIMGGLLMLAYAGPGRWALGKRRNLGNIQR